MATTAFWPVYNHLKETIDYSENPDKTIERKYVDDDLWQTIQYAENRAKTDETMYVSSINCPKQQAYEYMMRTKRRFHESGKIVATMPIRALPQGRSHRKKRIKSELKQQNVCGEINTKLLSQRILTQTIYIIIW